MAKKVETLGGTIIKKMQKVVKIKKNNNYLTSIVYLKDEKYITCKCDILVSSMPIKDLISEMNDVPKRIVKLANDLPYRDFF